MTQAIAAFEPLVKILDETWTEELREEIKAGRRALDVLRQHVALGGGRDSSTRKRGGTIAYGDQNRFDGF